MNGSLYIFCNESSLNVANLAIREAGFNTIRMLVWDKGATAGGDLDDYGTRCESILYSKRKYAKLRGARDSNLISIPRVHPTVLTHPAEKPETLISYLIYKLPFSLSNLSPSQLRGNDSSPLIYSNFSLR